MTRINLNTTLISKAELELRRKMNEQPLAFSGDILNPDIYPVNRGSVYRHSFKIKKGEFAPFGSVYGFGEEMSILTKYFYPYIKKDSSIVFDIGACAGSYSLSALGLGAKKVIGFEPDPRWSKTLNTNIDLNQGFRERFICVEKAVYNKDNLHINFDELEDVPTITIDSFVDETKLKPDYIKIDVDGPEALVIDGAIKTIERCKPKILVENHLKHSPGADKYIMDILTKLGYEYLEGPRQTITRHSFFR